MDRTRRDLLRLLTLTPVALAAGAPAMAGGDPIDHFRERYADLTSVDVSFSSERIQGRLRARSGGRYRIEAGDRLFISDGTSVWNVQTSTKTVVIDAATAQSDEMSVDRIFFVLLNVYQPTVKSGGSSPILRLSPPDPAAKIVGVDWADVALNARHEITSITVRENGTTTVWKITELRRNPRLKDDLFQFAPPDGWTTVDLR